MHPERRGENDPRRQSSLPSSLHALIIGPQQQAQDEPPKPSSSSGEPRESWDQGARAFRPVPSFPNPERTVGSLTPAAFDEESGRVGDRSRRRPSEPVEARAGDSRHRQPGAAQLPPLQSILPGSASPPEPRPQSHGSTRVGYSTLLPIPPSEPPRLPSLRPYWEEQAGPSSQPQGHPPPRHGYSYPMPQVQESVVQYSHLPPQLPPVSSSFPPPRYGGYYESGGEHPTASSSRQPYPHSHESYPSPSQGTSHPYEAGRGRISEARSEYGSPTLGHLRRHLEPESGGCMMTLGEGGRCRRVAQLERAARGPSRAACPSLRSGGPTRRAMASPSPISATPRWALSGQAISKGGCPPLTFEPVRAPGGQSAPRNVAVRFLSVQRRRDRRCTVRLVMLASPCIALIRVRW